MPLTGSDFTPQELMGLVILIAVNVESGCAKSKVTVQYLIIYQKLRSAKPLPHAAT